MMQSCSGTAAERARSQCMAASWLVSYITSSHQLATVSQVTAGAHNFLHITWPGLVECKHV
eukprot:1157757-Pelagomonas_calceolata.AAC.7